MAIDWDAIPKWIQETSYLEEFRIEVTRNPLDVNSKFNFLKGAYVGFAAKVSELERQVKEADEKFDLSRDYQRQLDIQALEELRDSITGKHHEAVSQRFILKQAIIRLTKKG